MSMPPVKLILVALGREDNPAPILAKAATLARCFHARIEIFLCEAERAFALQHQYDAGDSDRLRRSDVARLRAWMDRMWKSLDISDVPVSTDVVYETPLCEAINHRTRRIKPGLVIRGIGIGTVRTFSVSDYDLVSSCPAPLLLTRGRPWREPPRAAAAIDVSGDESPEHTRTILLAAQSMAEQCGATLELVYAQRSDQVPGAGEQAQRELLAARAADAGVRPLRMHVLKGDAARVIPEFVARGGYDLLVLGALTHRPGVAAQVGALTGMLVETVDCDLLLVKPPGSPS
jgi:universal stress protein E